MPENKAKRPVTLATAYRKLWPHRRRWHLVIKPAWDSPQEVWITAEWHDKPNDPHPLVCSCHEVWDRGLANAMNKMAIRLDAIEAALARFNEATKLFQEASAI